MSKIHFAKLHDIYALVAAIVVVTVLAWSLGLTAYLKPNVSKAAAFAEATDVVSDTDASVLSDHTIYLKLASNMSGSSTVEARFNTNFTSSSVVIGDFDVATSTARNGTFNEVVIGTTCAATTVLLLEFTGNNGFALKNCANGISNAVDVVMQIEFGSNATSAATGAARLSNPAASGAYRHTATLYSGAVGSTITDQSEFMTVVIEDVDVSATVSSTFSFGVKGTSSSEVINCNGSGAIDVTTTSTTIPWGNLSAGSPKQACHYLTAATNATNGFLVSVARDGNLVSETGADIDIYDDGVATGDTPTTWNSPAGTVTDELTWGHMGVTSEDDTTGTDLTGATVCGSGDGYASNAFTNIGVTSTPTLVFCHTGPANSATSGTGITAVGYEVETTVLQEAGTYRQSLTYIATPVY